MGAGQSSLSEEEVEQMKALTECINSMFYSLFCCFVTLFFFFKVDEDDLKMLFRKFQSIDKDGNGSLSVDEFLKIPELASVKLLVAL